MPRKDYRKDAPDSLKEEIDVSFFTDESIRNDAINAIRCQKLKDLEQWVGYSFDTDPMTFFEKLLAKLGLPGLKVKTNKDKWTGIEGKLLYLRVYKELPSNNYGVENNIRTVAGRYPEYKDLEQETLIARFHAAKLKHSKAIKTLREYIESPVLSQQDKLRFIQNLIDAIEKTRNSNI